MKGQTSTYEKFTLKEKKYSNCEIKNVLLERITQRQKSSFQKKSPV